MPDFKLMTEHKFEIKTSGDATTAVFNNIAAGIMSVDPSNNEELDQTKYLDGKGKGETDVIGSQEVWNFTGHRDYSDAAQNYIFGLKYQVGNARRSEFKWTDPNGDVIECDCTIANIKDAGGDAGAKGAISFEIHLNGEPTFTPAPTT